MASILFVRKFNGQSTPLGEIKSALGSLRAILPSNSVIGCVSYTQKTETVCQVANAMAPVSVVPYVAIRDTTLFVFNRNFTDSALHSIMVDRIKIWDQQSANYYFIVATNIRK